MEISHNILVAIIVALNCLNLVYLTYRLVRMQTLQLAVKTWMDGYAAFHKQQKCPHQGYLAMLWEYGYLAAKRGAYGS